MRDYGKVAPTYWTGNTGQALRKRGFEGAYVGAYLMTSPHANMLGLFYQPVLYLAEETGLPLEGAWKGLRICVAEGFCHYDEATKMVWVVEMAAWQIAKQLKDSDNRCAGIQKEYDALQNNPFLGPFFDRYQSAFHLKTRREYEGPSKPLRSQEQEQEQEQEGARSKSLPQKSTPRKAKAADEPERFAEFWALYPRKVDRADAVKAFRKLTEEQVAQAIEAIPKHVLHWQAEGRETKYIPHGATWLNGHSWTDELQAAVHRRQTETKPSRTAAITQALLDQRYARTAARQQANDQQSRLALGNDRARDADAHPAQPAVSAGRRYDLGDDDGLDEGDVPPRFHRR